MILSDRIKWIGLALLGLAIAAAVGIAASNLASREIGLASEPIEAGDALAPASIAKPRQPASRPTAPSKPQQPRSRPTPPSTTTPQTTPTVPTQAPEEPAAGGTPTVETQQPGGGDDHSASDHSGHAADD